MEQELLRLKQEAEEALAQVADAVQLEAFRVKYLGRKGGC
jgi:phenylalanyl-tRNA synthetase alpha chain